VKKYGESNTFANNLKLLGLKRNKTTRRHGKMENDVSIFIFISRNMNWKKHLDKNYLKTFRWRM
jgi:hypothetical protein